MPLQVDTAPWNSVVFPKKRDATPKLGRSPITYNQLGRPWKAAYQAAVEKSKRGSAFNTVVIVGYNLLRPQQLVEALAAARQTLQCTVPRCSGTACGHMTDRGHVVHYLELIGCPFINAEGVEQLTSLFPQLKHLTIHDCAEFDLAWMYDKVNKNPDWFKTLGFRVEIDFAEPTERNCGLIPTSVHPLRAYNGVRGLLVAAQWVHEEGSLRPGESIFLKQPMMMQHLLYMLNFHYQHSYDARTMCNVLQPQHIDKNSTKFPKWMVVDALQGKHLDKWLAHVTKKAYPRHENATTGALASMDYLKHFDCVTCDKEHPGLFFSNAALKRIKKYEVFDLTDRDACYLAQALQYSHLHVEELQKVAGIEDPWAVGPRIVSDARNLLPQAPDPSPEIPA